MTITLIIAMADGPSVASAATVTTAWQNGAFSVNAGGVVSPPWWDG